MSKKWLATALMLAMSSGPAMAFKSYEHREIGDAAFQAAITTLDKAVKGASAKLFTRPHLSREHKSISAVANGREVERFSFGELVATYGDFAETFKELNNSAFGKRVSDIRRIFGGASVVDFPREKNHMFHLATNNVTHFSLRAAQAYVQWHRKALLLAAKKDRLWEALHYEALALHSFTDLFAFGHMLDHRQLTDDLIKWSKKEKSKTGLSAAQRAWMARSAGKIMGGYVNFFHNAYNWKGAMLKNLAGDSWRGFGDGRFRIVDASCGEKSHAGKRKCFDERTKRQREIIVHATATSILDVLSVASGMPLAVGTEYSAMCLLPVHYAETRAPVGAENQKIRILRLAFAMNDVGRPIDEHGFDFSLGYLKFEKEEKKGDVGYIDYIRQSCGLI